MKNLFLALALMLVGTFAFANENTDVKTTSDYSSYTVTEYNFTLGDLLFKTCNITHNVVDVEGNLLMTVNYTVTVISGSCQGVSNSLIDDTYATYDELFG